jgi:hypothetical protein
MPTRYTRDADTGEYIAPVNAHFERSARVQCVPWPPGELLLSTYRRADDAIVIPALRAVAQLQRRRLARTLDCAYVRPLAVGDKPAYAAFRDPALRELCIKLRKDLLTHPSRMAIAYETAPRGRSRVRSRAQGRRCTHHPRTARSGLAEPSRPGQRPTP